MHAVCQRAHVLQMPSTNRRNRGVLMRKKFFSMRSATNRRLTEMRGDTCDSAGLRACKRPCFHAISATFTNTVSPSPLR